MGHENGKGKAFPQSPAFSERGLQGVGGAPLVAECEFKAAPLPRDEALAPFQLEGRFQGLIP